MIVNRIPATGSGASVPQNSPEFETLKQQFFALKADYERLREELKTVLDREAASQFRHDEERDRLHHELMVATDDRVTLRKRAEVAEKALEMVIESQIAYAKSMGWRFSVIRTAEVWKVEATRALAAPTAPQEEHVSELEFEPDHDGFQ